MVFSNSVEFWTGRQPDGDGAGHDEARRGTERRARGDDAARGSLDRRADHGARRARAALRAGARVRRDRGLRRERSVDRARRRRTGRRAHAARARRSFASRSRRRLALAMAEAGLHYDPNFVSDEDRAEIVRWLAAIQPIWENRFSERRAAAAGGQRRLLRPVYWLGSWQFACLDYYRPPNGVANRCVAAEPYPPVLARLVARIEKLARGLYRGADLPERWHLSTCLVNLYGSRLEDGQRVDCARVGEHRDFEPGPGRVDLARRARAVPVREARQGRRAHARGRAAVARRRLAAALRRRHLEEAPAAPRAARGPARRDARSTCACRTSRPGA